jgi:hypothetical protein
MKIKQIQWSCRFILFLSISCLLSIDLHAQLLFTQNFDDGQTHCAENSAIECQCHQKACHDCEVKIKVVKSPGDKTGMSCRHRLWNCDERAELQYKGQVRCKIGEERWYSWKIYFADDYFKNGGGSGLICRFPTYPTKRDFDDSCHGVGTDIRTTSKKEVILYFQRPANGKDIYCSHHLIANVKSGKWYHIVVHAKWTGDDDGFLEIWWDGKKVIDFHHQATFWNDEDSGPYFKMGLYKGDPWKGSEPVTLYTDDLEIFGEKSTFSEVFSFNKKIIQGIYAGNDAASVKAFEKWLGKPVDAVLAYTSGGSNGDWNAPDPGWQIDIKKYLGGSGRPALWSIPMAPDDGGADAYREIAKGIHNSLYASWAKKILKSRSGDKGPIYVRTTWELGGEWFSWTQAAKDDPQAYRQAFSEFASAFHHVSGRFKIVWDFTSDRGPVEQWYPGDGAVDVISQDVYWTPEYSGTKAAGAFEWIRNRERGLDWMVKFSAQHHKPMAISEWGVPGGNSTAYDGAEFIRLFETWVESHNVVYATYWDGGAHSGYDGRLSDGQPAKTAAALKRLYIMGYKNSRLQNFIKN